MLLDFILVMIYVINAQKSLKSGWRVQNKCFNCKWFFSCKKASEEIERCEWFAETEVKSVSKGHGEDSNWIKKKCWIIRVFQQKIDARAKIEKQETLFERMQTHKQINLRVSRLLKQYVVQRTTIRKERMNEWY